MYLGEIYFTNIFPEDIEQLDKALQRIGYYTKPSEDRNAEPNQYDLFSKEED